MLRLNVKYIFCEEVENGFMCSMMMEPNLTFLPTSSKTLAPREHLSGPSFILWFPLILGENNFRQSKKPLAGPFGMTKLQCAEPYTMKNENVK